MPWSTRWGLYGAITMFVILLAAHTALVRAASRGAGSKRRVVFFDMIVTSEDNRYSLSRLQVYLWTVIVAICFTAVSFATGQFASIPQNLALLMGVNLGAAVASTAIFSTQDAKAKARPETFPSFIRDIFFEVDVPYSLDLPRAQMFFWTLVTLVTYVVLFVQNFSPARAAAQTFPVLPDIPVGMLALMGVSQGAYLGAKAAPGRSQAPTERK